jgi:hypothetical protein
MSERGDRGRENGTFDESAERLVKAGHGQVLMGEEVFATWIATSLVLSVMGTQFTSRPGIHQSVRIALDIATMTLSLMVMVWATMSHFNVISHRTRIVLLIFLMAFLIVLILSVIVCVAQLKV